MTVVVATKDLLPRTAIDAGSVQLQTISVQATYPKVEERLAGLEAGKESDQPA
jgi:hypothetical protein